MAYRVIIWNTGQIIDEFEDLRTAKKIARHQGHNGQSNGKYYAPIARVDEPANWDTSKWGTIYNPVFKIGKDDDYKPTPYVKTIVPGPRKCSHGLYHGCPKGCN